MNQLQLVALIKKHREAVEAAETDDEIVKRLHALTNCTHGYTDKIEEWTRAQADCPLWHVIRSYRITASIAGSLIKYDAGTDSFPYGRDFLPNHIKPTEEYKAKMDQNPYIRYGKKTEPVVLATFLDKNRQVSVRESGIIILPFYQWLAVSPDGIGVYKNSKIGFTVEIKCPSSTYKSFGNTAAVKLLHDMGIVSYTGDEAFLKEMSMPIRPHNPNFQNATDRVNKRHPYYIQCMMQMYAMQQLAEFADHRIDHCYFVVWDRKNSAIYTARFDYIPEMVKIVVDRLYKMYHSHFIPEFLEQYRQRQC